MEPSSPFRSPTARHTGVKKVDEPKAKKILKGMFKRDGSIDDSGRYIWWKVGSPAVQIDAVDLTADELEALAWWMRNHGT